jgi:hypothetical protein
MNQTTSVLFGNIKSVIISGCSSKAVALYLLMLSIRRRWEQSLYHRRYWRAPWNEKREDRAIYKLQPSQSGRNQLTKIRSNGSLLFPDSCRQDDSVYG